MASTFSPTLRLELIGDGDQSGIWGQTTNNNLGALVEQAITGVITIAMVDANYTLANFNGVVDEARNQVLVLTGALSAQRNLIAPLVEKTYIVRNTTTGGFGVQIIGPSGTGVIIPNGTTASVFCDGTNFFPATTGSLGNQVINGNLSVTGTTSLTGALTASTATFSGAISSVNPTFTGTPTAPTAISGTNTTQIATTAFVQNVAGALGTMSTQNANNVAITGGSINGTTIGASTAASIAGTTGNFSGNLASLGSVSGATGIFGAVSGTTGTFSSTVSGSSFTGAGTGLTGTAGSLSIGGNAATATNAVTVTTTVASGATGTTQTPGTNNTTIATTAFVTGAIGSLGTMSTQNANNVAITGGSITGITDLAVVDGGTGASSITANSVVLGNGSSALSGNLVAPGTSGNVLTSNGTTWTSAANASPGVLYNQAIGNNQTYSVSLTGSNRPVQLFLSTGTVQGGNTYIQVTFEWGIGALNQSYTPVANGVNFVVQPCPALTAFVTPSASSTLFFRISTTNLSGIGSWASIIQL
jgi:hypothetical protein